MCSSTPSVSASSEVDGSSRSRPRSSAKWLRVPAAMTMNGMSCWAATPATSAWVPSPPATPSRSAPLATARLRKLDNVDGARPLQQRHFRPQMPRALAGSANLGTFPPPDRGFMITNGRAGGGVSYSVIPAGGAARASAARPAATATPTSASAVTTTHNSPDTA